MPPGPRRETPAMQQYGAFKKRFPGCIVFFRMGDFYEMFDDDAVTAARVLGITLTQRTEGIPMAGVPYHSAENYLRRMVAAGYRVVTCDQVQDPREAKGVIERAVTRILTPGTLVDDAHLDSEAPSALAAVSFLDAGESPDARVAVAVVELSTGAFTLLDCRAASLVDELSRRAAREVLYPEASITAVGAGGAPPRVKRALDALSLPGTARPPWHFRHAEALDALREHFAVASLAGFGLSDDDPAVGAAGAILRYLRETQAMDDADRPTSEGFSSGSAVAFMLRRKSLAHIAPPRRENPTDSLMIDATSLRALEVERTLRAGAAGAGTPEGSLLWVFSQPGRSCRTPMGRRLLRDWLCRPLAQRAPIEARQWIVGVLAADPLLAGALASALSGDGKSSGAVQDVPRIAARVALARATPRDLVALGRSLARVDDLLRVCDGAPALAAHHARLAAVRESLAPLAQRITASCVDDPPGHLREGGLFRSGVDPVLDEARTLRADAGAWMANYQKSLIETHDLPSLKVGFNQVFGYYIELPAAQSRRAPAEFTRKQTLKNAERYITPELKEFEEKVLTAGERAVRRELELFGDLGAAVAARAREINEFSDAAAELDTLACFAAVAVHRRWCKPTIVDEPILDITQGRHPVLEIVLGDQFVPNDVRLGVRADDRASKEAVTPRGDVTDEPPETTVIARISSGSIEFAGPSLALITGPNMAGKSTYIRQVALITILAHAGAFVPAERAVVGLVDRVFTRIGADDALHAGQSTFMVEMIETANILHHATPRSLVVLDEIGRGTSTLDGLSLAWAIAEQLATPFKRGSSPSTPPRTLFATHYHELTDLADQRPERAMNLHVAVREWGDQIVFLHQILPGRANRSYGIHVAKLAGLPSAVVKRATQLLDSLAVSHSGASSLGATAKPARENGQLTLFKEYLPHPVIEEIKSLDLTALSPLQAFDALRQLAEKVASPAASASLERK